MLLAVCPLLVGCAGVAPSMLQCGFEDIESGRDEPEKLPNGLIGQSGGAGPPPRYASYYEVQDCRSGDLLTLYKTREGEETDRRGRTVWTVSPARTAQVEEVRQMSLRGEALDLTILERMARGRGIQVLGGTDAKQQSCGCAAFYPELRGDKVAYAPEQ